MHHPMNDHLHYYLSMQQKTRAARIAKYKKKETKKKRNFKLHAKLKEYSEKIKVESAKLNGCIYQPGIGMDGGYCQPMTEGGAAADDEVGGDSTPAALSVCKHCGIAGHKRTTHRECGMYRAPRGVKLKQDDAAGERPPVASVTTTPTNDENAVVAEDGDSEEATQEDPLLQDAAEQALLDVIPFDETDDEFFDALEAADDADDSGMVFE